MAGVAVIEPEGRISEVQIEGLVSFGMNSNNQSCFIPMRESHGSPFSCCVFLFLFSGLDENCKALS